MRTLKLLLLLLIALPVPAVSGSPAPARIPILAANVDSLYDHGGILYFGGTKIDTLQSLAVIDSNTVVVNGYALESKVEVPVKLNTPEGVALSDVFRIGEQLIAEGKAKRQSNREILEAWRDSCAAIPDISSVRIGTYSIRIRTKNLQVTYNLDDPRFLKPQVSKEKVMSKLLLSIQNALKAGCVVWLENGSVRNVTPPNVPQFNAAVAKVRRGEPLTPDERKILPESSQQLMRQPIRMIRTL